MMPVLYDLQKPMLEYAKDNPVVTDSEVEKYLAEKFNLTHAERTALKSSGGETLFLNKIRWAKHHLELAKLITKKGRAKFAITLRGRNVIETNPERITEKFLSRFPEYSDKRGLAVKFKRIWAMPNKWTTQIQPIDELITEEIEGFSVDPFCGQSEHCDLRNDINPESTAHTFMDAYDFLQTLGRESVDTMVYDPPFSVRQVSESYKAVGIKVDNRMTQADFWTELHSEINRVLKKGGKMIMCGWNTGGFTGFGFALDTFLDVPHGGPHNDTLVTVWRKGYD